MVLTFESVGEFLSYDHSNEISSAVYLLFSILQNENWNFCLILTLASSGSQSFNFISRSRFTQTLFESTDLFSFREGTFFIGWWWGWAGPTEGGGGSSVKFLQIWEGQTCFVCRWGRVTLLSEGIKYSMLLLKSTLLFMLTNIQSLWKTKTCMYKQSY